MTERTIRMQAKELAGIFYEDNRSEKFRRAFPTFRDYMQGRWHQPDGSIVQSIPGWQHHVELARKILALMLGKPDSVVSKHMKEKIFDALIEDRNTTLKAKARGKAAKFHQAGMSPDA